MSGINLAAVWDLSVDNPPDLGPRGNRYPGVGANIVGHPDGIHGGSRCTEFNGNNSNINVGDVVELNAVSAFTIAFWMNQDVIDVTDIIFQKRFNDLNRIRIRTANTGRFEMNINDGSTHAGYFDYSTVMDAGRWHHIVWVFDGTLTGDANRLKACVDGAPIALTFSNGIPAVTFDLAGSDAILGYTSSAFDGELDDFRIFDAALDGLMCGDLYERTRKGILR